MINCKMLHFNWMNKSLGNKAKFSATGEIRYLYQLIPLLPKCTLNRTMSEIRKKVAISAHSLTRKERLSLLWWLEFTELEASHPNLKLSKYLNML